MSLGLGLGMWVGNSSASGGPPDTTAPTLSSPVGTQTGSTTATIGATTNEGNGTMYGVVTTSVTAPTATQVKAGQNNGGTAAVFAGSVAVSSTGAKTISATGLTASTAYYAHIMHEDAAGNKSNVVSSAQFTTASGSWTPASLSNLAAWYDADQQTESADAAVATLTDRSGNSNHFTQATGANQPLLRYAAINGKKALDFDGATDSMTCATGLLNGATAGAFFAVVQLDADPPASGGPVVIGFDTTGTGAHHPYSDGTIYDGFGSTARKTCGNPTPSLASVSMLAAISGASDYRFLVNNSTLFSTATNTVGFGTGTRQIGQNIVSAELFSGLLAELIICNAVPNSTDISNIRSYFNTKFGTSF